MRQFLRPFLLALNHCFTGIVCLYLVMSGEFTFEERTMYAISAIFFWMGVQRLVRKAMPL
jgi:hypothetical protein